MISIRQNVFETNSSSTHSITMCLTSQFEEWKNGERFFIDDYSADTGLVTFDELVAWVKKKSEKYSYYKSALDKLLAAKEANDEDEIERVLESIDIKTYSMFEDSELETYEEHYTTPGGESITAFGKYGYDG